jgi:hypothetical protein
MRAMPDRTDVDSKGRMMSPELVKVINKATEDLVSLIKDDDEVCAGNIPNIHSIHIEPDYHNPRDFLIVWANLVNPYGQPIPYQYAVYVNTTTLHTETDGF